MSVQSEISRLETAKTAIKDAISGKGVSVPSNTKLESMAGYIGQIEGGGGTQGIDRGLLSSVSFGVFEVSQFSMTLSADATQRGNISSISVSV